MTKPQNWQQQTAEFAEKHNLTHDPGVYLVDLLSELGEVGKAWLTATQYGERPFPSQPPPNFTEELGDTLYSLCQLANATGVNLENALQNALQKYQTRWQAKGHTGSQP